MGNTIDFFLAARRNIYAAKRFLGKALRRGRRGTEVSAINTDRNLTYATAIAALRKRGTLPEVTEHRQVKYLNNGIECDRGKIKRLLKPGLGFHSMKTAYATLKGIEVIRMFRKGQFSHRYHAGRPDAVSFINQLFGLFGDCGATC